MKFNIIVSRIFMKFNLQYKFVGKKIAIAFKSLQKEKNFMEFLKT